MEKELKVSERSKVLLVRDKRTRGRSVYREYAGSGEVYRAMQGIECPYLPRIEAVEEHNGYVYIVEEYVQGDTLAFILKGGTLDEELAKRITIQICRALEPLHALGVVHRDIKPENIILRGEEAVLIDFDASRLCKEEQNSDTQVMGTIGYAAPEQYGFSQTDARADIYALGILLNEMLIRQHPAKQLATGRLLPTIEKCIEVNMDKRYSSVRELRSALEHEVSGTPNQKKAIWKRSLVAVLAAALVLGGAFYGVNKISTFAETNDPVSPSEDIIPTSSKIESLQPVQISWHNDPEAYGTEFQYDLDGDGREEEYLFGGIFYRSDGNFAFSDGEVGLPAHKNYINNRYVAPGVWKQTSSGSYELVEAFAPLLTDAKVTIHCLEGDSKPEIWQEEELMAPWSGAIRVEYTQNGVWQYEFSAKLAGRELSAVALTRTTREE